MRKEPSAPHVIDLLRFTTAGSVDDGKSTLIGRLLHDTQSLATDQLEAVERASRRYGEAGVNLALLTDGLRAEREQKITIDVAFRYFSTRRRKFIIADTPGHVQYTRNMVTGASTADLAIVLIDASTGAQEQSHRHAFIASLLGIPHLIVAVNKMDLVGYEERAFDAVVEPFRQFAAKLTTQDVTYLPISALRGDNVVTPSPRMPWYGGGSLLHRLETVQIGPRNAIDFRFPVQCVMRPHAGFRGYAGSVASGSITAGEQIVVLPSGVSTRIKSIDTFDGKRASASAGDAVVLTTTDDVDISRGDLIVRAGNQPLSSRVIDAYLCWMDPAALDARQSYVFAQTTRRVACQVSSIAYRIDVSTLHRDAPVQTLRANDIGRVTIASSESIAFDSYRSNPATGNFVLIDPRTNQTVAAGMIRGAATAALGVSRTSPDVVAEGPNISQQLHESRNGHRAAVVWLTGMPGSGKTTIARAVERMLFDTGHQTSLLDGDALRHGINGDLGFSPADRAENIRRAGEVARLFFANGSIVLCAFVSPYRADRERARALIGDAFVEAHITASPETLRTRDPKGHYRRAITGDIAGFTGISAPYEIPAAPEVTIDTDALSIDEAARLIVEVLRSRGWLRADASH